VGTAFASIPTGEALSGRVCVEFTSKREEEEEYHFERRVFARNGASKKRFFGLYRLFSLQIFLGVGIRTYDNGEPVPPCIALWSLQSNDHGHALQDGETFLVLMACVSRCSIGCLADSPRETYLSRFFLRVCVRAVLSGTRQYKEISKFFFLHIGSFPSSKEHKLALRFLCSRGPYFFSFLLFFQIMYIASLYIYATERGEGKGA